jgi:hypothetical protein
MRANAEPSVPVFNTGFDDTELMHIAQHVGPDRWLAAGAAAGL